AVRRQTQPAAESRPDTACDTPGMQNSTIVRGKESPRPRNRLNAGRWGTGALDCAGPTASIVDRIAIVIRAFVGFFRRLLPCGRINALTQFLAGLEVRYVFARHHHFFPGFRVTPDARGTRRQGKAAEAANLDTLARDQGLSHGLEHRLDSNVRIANRELRVAAREYRNQLRLGHAINRRRELGPAWPSTVHPGWWYRRRHWLRTYAE